MKFKSSKPDARILLILIILGIWLSFSLSQNRFMIVLFLVVDIALLVGTNCDRKSFIKNLVIYFFLQGLLLGLSKIQVPFFEVVLSPFIMIMLRIYPITLLVELFVKRIPVNELMYSLERMHMPKSVLIPIMVIYRYVPTILKEIKIIHAGIKMRGLGCRIKHPDSIVNAANYYMTALISRSEKLSDELSAAAICKGLSVKRDRSCITKVKIQLADILVLCIGIAFTAGMLYLNQMLR